MLLEQCLSTCSCDRVIKKFKATSGLPELELEARSCQVLVASYNGFLFRYKSKT